MAIYRSKHPIFTAYLVLLSPLKKSPKEANSKYNQTTCLRFICEMNISKGICEDCPVVICLFIIMHLTSANKNSGWTFYVFTSQHVEILFFPLNRVDTW